MLCFCYDNIHGSDQAIDSSELDCLSMSKNLKAPVSKTTPRPRKDVPDPKIPSTKAASTTQREPRTTDSVGAQSPFNRRESKLQRNPNASEESLASSIVEINNVCGLVSDATPADLNSCATDYEKQKILRKSL